MVKIVASCKKNKKYNGLKLAHLVCRAGLIAAFAKVDKLDTISLKSFTGVAI